MHPWKSGTPPLPTEQPTRHAVAELGFYKGFDETVRGSTPSTSTTTGEDKGEKGRGGRGGRRGGRKRLRTCIQEPIRVATTFPHPGERTQRDLQCGHVLGHPCLAALRKGPKQGAVRNVGPKNPSGEGLQRRLPRCGVAWRTRKKRPETTARTNGEQEAEEQGESLPRVRNTTPAGGTTGRHIAEDTTSWQLSPEESSGGGTVQDTPPSSRRGPGPETATARQGS